MASFTSKDDKIADDVLWGAAAIAEEIGLPVREVFYQLELGRLPAKKVGAIWVASRTKLRDHLGLAA